MGLRFTFDLRSRLGFHLGLLPVTLGLGVALSLGCSRIALTLGCAASASLDDVFRLRPDLNNRMLNYHHNHAELTFESGRPRVPHPALSRP